VGVTIQLEQLEHSHWSRMEIWTMLRRDSWLTFTRRRADE
jgi:hypothetical protein